MMLRKMVLGMLLAFACAMACADPAISAGTVRIGVLTDLTALFSEIGGRGSIVAARMAAEDFGGKVKGAPIEVLFADHHNSPEIAADKARDWFDNKNVDVIVDLLPSSVALVVADIARQKNKIVLVSGGGTSRLTNENCSPNTVHYVYDTYALATATVNTLMKQKNDTWFFVTADFAVGHSLEKDATETIADGKGRVTGSIRHPTNAPDMTPYLMKAQASGAKVIALANAGGDLVASMKKAEQFDMLQSRQQTMAGLMVFISDVRAMGVRVAQGMILTTGFYWDLNEETRAWSRRFFERHGRMPTMVQAGVYSSIMHYLRAIEAAGTDDAATVMARMKSTPINDFFAKNGRIREDGRMVHDMYLMEVKKVVESRGAWDYYKLKSVIPGEEAFLPLSKSVCPLVNKAVAGK